MLNDFREITTPPVETGSTGKIIAAIVVVLGFGAIGAYTYETGTWNSSPKQIVASKQISSPAPLASAEPSVAPPQETADLPPAPAPVKNVPAPTPPQAAATPPVRVARAQTPAPALPQAPAAQPPGNVSAPTSPQAAAPSENIPEQPAPQDISPPVTAPAQDAPAQNVPEQPAEAIPVQ